MTRRKSVCLKWTLVLIIVVVSPSVYSRPQENFESSDNFGQPDISAQTPIRYRYEHNNLSLSSIKLIPVVISFINKTHYDGNKSISNISINENDTFDSNMSIPITNTKELGATNTNPSSNREGRLIRTNTQASKNKLIPKPHNNVSGENALSRKRKKTAIRKVLTKWRDKTKYDDLKFSYESTTMPENTKNMIKTSTSYNSDEISTESSDEVNSKRYSRPPGDMYYNLYNKPRPQYSEESNIHSSNVQIMDTNSYPNVQVIDHYSNYPTRPPYFHTNVPTPMPIITNIGYPQPWTPTVKRTTTQRPKPTKYEYYNNVHNHGGNNEVTTFEPSSSYTDRIVIRPEEYSPYPEDCPTIFLTLNNTFQGEGKESCPDLNIAVNTNVINKNVVVESEEDSDSFFPDFGLGLGGESGLSIGDDSDSDSSKDEDYIESDENTEQTESESNEGTELVNYHSVNSPIQSESSEASGHGAASSPISAITKPSHHGSDDDIFGMSSLLDFFQPALKALGWLTSVNPMSLGFFPLLLAPLGILFAGSGVAALFAPWFLPLGREAPKIIQIYKPEWRWDENLKTWQLHSFPNNRRDIPKLARAISENNENNLSKILLSQLKNWLTMLTRKLTQKPNNQTMSTENKIKRRKREIRRTRLK